MAIEHPFQFLFEAFGRPPAAHAESVNRLAYQALRECLGVPPAHGGRCILLRAPGAGYGKTHLLSRIQHDLAAGHEFLQVHAAAGTRIDAATVTDDVLRRLTSPVSAAGALCALDLVVRRLFSLALQPLVRSGEVPCLDRDATLASLCEHPLETFDFHHPDALSAHWTRDNFAVLGPRLALELAQLTGCPRRAVGFWVEALFRFAVATSDQSVRVDALFLAALGESCGEGAAVERLGALLSLLSLLGRVVLVADDLDGLAAASGSALRMAAFLGALRRSAARVDVILSLNRDVWECAFAPYLSSALAERLAEVLIELEPLADADRVALLDAHTPGMGARMLTTIGPDSIERHARSLLRAAGAAWLKVARDAPPVAAGEPAASAPPHATVTPSPYQEPAAKKVIAPPAAISAATFAAESTPPRPVAPAPVTLAEPPPVRPVAITPVTLTEPPPAPPVALAPVTLAEPPPVRPVVPAPVTLAEPPPVRPVAPAPVTLAEPPPVRPVVPAPAPQAVPPPVPPAASLPPYLTEKRPAPPVVPAAVTLTEPPPVRPGVSAPVNLTESPPLRPVAPESVPQPEPSVFPKPAPPEPPAVVVPSFLTEPPPLPPSPAPAPSLLAAFEKSMAAPATVAVVAAAAPESNGAGPEPAAVPTTGPVAPDPGPEAAETVDAERVDALLRQFRERYGRPDSQ